MSDHYPGSKQTLIDYTAPEEITEDDELTTLLGAPYKTTKSGRSYYSIGSLARALNRSPVCMRKWEANGTLPMPTLAAKGKRALGGQVRLYTREQIEGLRLIAAEEGILAETWHAVKHTNFRERAHELFIRLQEAS